MKLGFYYHSAFRQQSGDYFVPGYIGVFIDELAAQTEILYLFLEHQANPESTEEDYKLRANNIIMIDLGPKSSFYKRLLSPFYATDKIHSYQKYLDAFIIRSPTPLAPHIFKKINGNIPVYPLVVGDYLKGLKDLSQPFFRKIAIVILMLYYQILHNRMLSSAPKIFVNSGELENEYKKRAKDIVLIKTTTLDGDSFFKREDTCQNPIINILYTGRITFQKGLRELLDAVIKLKQKYNIKLHIVGWEEQGAFSPQKALEKIAYEKGFSDCIVFHGKKKVGPELTNYYKLADIYVIPSYHEGFPRTIWEAMAASVPVIATNVGSIPHYLTDKVNALIIDPKNVSAIENAIEMLINNKGIRKSIITNAYMLVGDNTLHKQTKILINNITTFNIK